MTRLPVVDFKTMEKVILHLGFQRVRQKGSHNHPGRDLSRPLVREILREIEISGERFVEELQKL